MCGSPPVPEVCKGFALSESKGLFLAIPEAEVSMRGRITVLLTAVCVLWAAVPSSAQYFGRNKVQYERFDFKVLATEHFDIYYYPEEEAAIRLAAQMAERWYARLSKLLQHELRGRQPLILYAAHPHFQHTNTLAGEIG